MLYKANISFSGLVSMTKGEIRELSDENVINDLLQCKYIEEVKREAKKEKVEEVTAPKKSNKK